MMSSEVRTKSEYRSSLRSKALIRKAFLDLLDEKPYDKITITDIVKKADINRGTFYLHYKDISEVLKQIALSILDELIGQFEKKDIKKFIANPSEAFCLISSFLQKNFQYYKKLIELDVTGFVLHEALSRGKNFVARYTRNISLDCGPEPEVIIDYILAGSVNIYCEILKGESTLSLEDASEYLGQLAEVIITSGLRKNLLTEAIAE